MEPGRAKLQDSKGSEFPKKVLNRSTEGGRGKEGERTMWGRLGGGGEQVGEEQWFPWFLEATLISTSFPISTPSLGGSRTCFLSSSWILFL